MRADRIARATGAVSLSLPQGGICAVLDPLDSVESHANDTMVAGDFLCDQAVVDLVCREGANAVLELVAMVRALRLHCAKTVAVIQTLSCGESV
jgi:aspartate oxidase